MRKIPGIFVRPPGSEIHWISYLGAGKRRREKAGTLAAAVRMLADRKTQIRRNEYVAPRRVATFAWLANQAIQSKALRLTAATVETDEYRLVKLIPLIGKVTCGRLTAQRIEATLATLKHDSGLSPSTLNRYRSFMSSVFSYAVKNEHMGANPCARVGRFKENESRIRWLRPDEEKKLRLEFAPGGDPHEWEFDLALYTGMRRGELWSLKWADVDLDGGQLTVRGKTGRRHVVANAAAVLALRSLQGVSGDGTFVVQERNESPEARRDLRTWLERAVKRAGIRDFHYHDIRHTFASRLVMKGVDIRTVQELMGHKSIVQTMKYSHLSSDHRQKAAAKLKAGK